jgi:hypothetical protein
VHEVPSRKARQKAKAKLASKLQVVNPVISVATEIIASTAQAEIAATKCRTGCRLRSRREKVKDMDMDTALAFKSLSGLIFARFKPTNENPSFTIYKVSNMVMSRRYHLALT